MRRRRAIRDRELIDERGRLAKPVVEARHAEAHHLLGLIAAHARRRAGLDAHRDPSRGVVVESRRDRTSGRVGSRRSREAARDAVAPGVVPRVLRDVLARRGRARAARGEDDAAGDRRRRRDRATASAGVARREVREQRVERRVACGRCDRHPAPQRTPHPAGDAAAPRRLAWRAGLDAARERREVVAVERARVEQRDVERDAERELIACARRPLRPGAARAPCRAACPSRAPVAVSGVDGAALARTPVTARGARAVDAREPEVDDAHAAVAADDHVLAA